MWEGVGTGRGAGKRGLENLHEGGRPNLAKGVDERSGRTAQATTFRLDKRRPGRDAGLLDASPRGLTTSVEWCAKATA